MSVFPRILPAIASTIALAIAGVAGCSGTEEGLAGIGAKKPSPTSSALDGDVSGSDDDPAPTPSPTPTPSPSPSPTPQIVATSVSISPASLRLSVPAGIGTGALANYPTAATLSAIVTMSNGSTSSAVTWDSLDPVMATISATTGALSILAPGSGSGPWTVQIKATSLDGKATGTRNVTVTYEGDVALTVE